MNNRIKSDTKTQPFLTMLSRRNIRIKVMQALYTMKQDATLDFKAVERNYKWGINRSFDLYVFNLLQFQKVAQYAKKDAQNRDKKLLPTDEDKAFTPKLATNSLLRSLTGNQAWIKLCNNTSITQKASDEIAKTLYTEFAKTEKYKKYLQNEALSEKEHQEMLLDLYRFCSKNELFTELMSDHFMSWVDDESLVVGALKKTIRAFPVDEKFFEDYRPAEETVKEYGEELLYKVDHLEESLLEIIKPRLKNWEAERVAIIDMILLKMAVCEMLKFPTIPTKVTINEYVEISKLYSTPKSKDFINGLLDKLLKQLSKDDKIKKSGRGLID